MKKEFLVAVSVLFGMAASLSVSAQEKLSLKQCREMALKYNKEMAAADKQTEAARLLSLSYKANFFPNFTASGTGLYSTADGSLGIRGGNLPVFLPADLNAHIALVRDQRKHHKMRRRDDLPIRRLGQVILHPGFFRHGVKLRIRENQIPVVVLGRRDF